MSNNAKGSRLTLGASVLCLSLFSTNVQSDSSVTITLQGLVATTCLATFQIAGEGQNLDLTMDAANVLVANGTLLCNEANGFTATLTSTNGVAETVNSGMFLANNISQVTNRLPYDVTFESSDGTISPVVFVNGVASGVSQGGAGDAINETFELKVSFVGDTSLQADSYSDQLTLAIAAL